MILEMGHASHPGQKCDYNGDHYSGVQHWVTDAQLAEKGWLFLLADDVGGDASSESSRHAVNRLSQLYYTSSSSSIRQSLQQAITRVNNEIYEESRRHQSAKCVMILAAALHGNQLEIANVGRVRAHQFHKRRLRQLTPDRSWEEVRPTALDTPESRDAPDKAPPARALGVSRRVLIDWAHASLAVGDTLLLTTDGLHETVSASEMQEALASRAKPQEIAESLVATAAARGNEDNATALLLTARERGRGGSLPAIASWVLWAVSGIAILAALVGLATWSGSFSLRRPPPTPSPTATLAQRTQTLPAVLHPTATPPNTATPTATLPPTATARPVMRTVVLTATPPPATATVTPTPIPVLYNAPRVIAPYNDEAVYQGENNVLVWQWYRQLQADEVFEIRLWKEGTQPPARGALQTSAMEFRFGVPSGLAGKYFWNVYVVRRSGSGSEIVSVPSETHFFWWMGPRPQPPTATPQPPTPVPPTNTPVPPTDTPQPPTDTPMPLTPTPLP